MQPMMDRYKLCPTPLAVLDEGPLSLCAGVIAVVAGQSQRMLCPYSRYTPQAVSGEANSMGVSLPPASGG